MNSRIIYPIIALAFAIAAAGCGKSSKLNTPSQAPGPAAPVELKLKWTPGERIVQEFDVERDMAMNIPKQPAPVHQVASFGQKFSLIVADATPDGGHDLNMEIQAIHVLVKTGDNTSVEYDSEKNSAANSANPVAKMFAKLIGAKISYVFDQSNHVVSVQGVQELTRRVQGSPSNAALFKGIFNEDYFKQIMDGSRFLPPDPVQPGDTWPVKISQPAGMVGTLGMDLTFTFKGWEMHGPRSCARVEFTGTMDSEPGGKAGPNGITVTLQDGTMTGVYWWDPEFGMPIDSNTKVDTTALISFPKRMQAQIGEAVMTNQVTEVISSKVDSLN